MHSIDAAYCNRCRVSVCVGHTRALQKQLNRSRYHLGATGWPVNHVLDGVQILRGKG